MQNAIFDPTKILTLIACACFLTGTAAVHAESVASKNKTGNRLFEQGKYQDAEKAYLDARGDAPEKPELVYNLGNALLKQKKYDQALQSLAQASAKADRGLQAKAWFNSGDALFEMGRYQDAAQAFIQSLRINPGDRDAKNNLELALRKLQEQQKQQKSQGKDSQEKNQKQQDSSSQPNDKQSANQQEQKQTSGEDQKKQTKPDRADQAQVNRRENNMNKEKAMQILDAMRDQELQEQRKLVEHSARRKAVGKDW